jgi:hypothetical protein
VIWTVDSYRHWNVLVKERGTGREDVELVDYFVDLAGNQIILTPASGFKERPTWVVPFGKGEKYQVSIYIREDGWLVVDGAGQDNG